MDQHHQRAQLLINQNRFELAEQELGAILTKNPQDAVAHLLMSICYKHTKRYREATDSARQAISLQPENPRCHLILASVYLMRNRYDEAEASAMESLRLDPYDEDTCALMAQLKYSQKDWEASLQWAKKGLEIDPDEPSCQSLRTLALERLGRRDVAVATSKEALSRNPDDSYTHATHAWALLNNGDHKQAQESFREALRLDPTNDFAKQGMIQALNANHFLFRMMFKWYSFIGRMSDKLQWVIILGLFFGNRILNSLAESYPAIAPYVQPIVFLYLIFAITTWIANPVFNTILRFNRYGKYLLDDRQVMASNVMAAMAAFGLILGIVLALAFPEERLLNFMIGFGYALFMLMPIAATFNCEDGYPLIVMTVVTVTLGVWGLGAIGMMFVVPGLAVYMLIGFIYANIGSQFLGNYMASVEVQR
ncbi:tetratricopeptide repeat protein [Mariniblastus fucicola]|uniref:Tetratricopeptide repeat protein n=1 Tax=Mariniblastus fucicola TaxID=980251 RepID=A0A5B9P4X4_9BACT|nr:tetratricopeptide repeat protein [Mariniblastus fucicola]QEG20539.1 Tetratricopeptide repeat protein [Mariniblastus fucicola]